VRWRGELSRRKSRRSPTRSRTRYYLVGGVAIAAIVGYLFVSISLQGQGVTTTQTQQTTQTTQTTSVSQTGTASKPIILYVNQGNGVVNGSNFGELLSTATSHGFNTIFFQIYRSGTLLFTDGSLSQFVASAHGQGLKIFFALYFTNSTQEIPSSIYADGEDGINLDMSTLPIGAQTTLLTDLSSTYSGKTAITTTDPTLPLNPDLLVLETYGAGNDQYIHHGIIASVGVFATSSRQDYEQQLQYALQNSDGVMVFDYAGLVKAGY
jgi:hypothetical protein